jgi:lipopolysaccharide transport system ATP-binding protein
MSSEIVQAETEQATPALPATAEVVVSAQNLGKMYHLYQRPQDRLKQAFLWGRATLYREFWALRGVSFEIRRGEVVGVIGRNGSGKSTLLQILSGVLKPSTGKATVRGRVAALLELGSGFNPEFSGRENIYLNGTILGLTRQQIDERFDAIVDFADIRPFIDQPVKTYSSGMYMRLAFAISVHVDAEVLVVDEALSVGDAAFQFKCLHHLEELLSRGVTVLLVSHDMQLVKSYCTRAIYLKDGAVLYQGDCEAATEMFVMEMQAARRAQMSGAIAAATPGGSGSDVAGGHLTTKPALEGAAGLRFGSNKGAIDSVRIGAAGEQRNLFAGSERVWVEVRAHVAPEVRRPRLAMVVRDLKGYNLFGYNTTVAECDLKPDADGYIGGRFGFACSLKAGYYSIMVRLDDWISDKLSVTLDRQPNAATFQVLAKRVPFDGVVDLEGTFEPLPQE